PPPPDGYAVIAWLHGGDFSSGSATELNPFQLVLKQKVIVVSIAYRLGIFGFLTTADGEAPGNFGLMDQSAALLWVKAEYLSSSVAMRPPSQPWGMLRGRLVLDFISFFGLYWSEGLFTRAIMMSGSPLLETNVREAKAYGSALDRTAKTFGCFRRPTSKLINCLRNVPAQILADSAPVNDWGPVIDDGLSNQTTPFVPDAPKALVERGQIHKVPLMIGFTDMEEVLELAVGDILTEGISSEMYDTLLGDMVLNELSQFESNDSCAGNNQIVIDAVNFVYKPYPPTMEPTVLRKRFIDFSTEKKFAAPAISLAAAMSQKKGDVFAYRFDMKARSAGVLEGVPEWVGVPHGFDALFVWGLPYWAQLPSGAQWDRADKQIAEIIMTLWANFAKFGNPTEMGVYIKWEKFTADSPGILIVDRAFNMSDRSNMNYGSVQFWNEYYPKVVTFASQCCNATNVAASWHTDIPREATGILLLAHFGIFLATLIARTYKSAAPPPPDGYAVIAWLHGGDFSSGSATELNPFQLVLKQKVIVVSIAYRLGIFGFLTTADGEAPGNFGLMDQSAALLWVKRNIKLFGGNEASITAMGHASGAISVGLHLISGDWSEGLFTRAIMMSGSPLLETNVREAKAYGSALDRTAKTFGCFRRPTSKLINCLRNVPAQILADSAPVNDWGPVIDDGLSNQTTPFVPDAPKALVERGQIHKVPLMIGFTDMEKVLELAVGDILTEGISSEMYDTLLGDMVLNELSQFESNDSCAGNNQIVIDAVNFLYKPYPPTMEPTVLRKRFIDFSTEKKFAAPAISLAAAMSQKKGDVFAYRFDMKARSAGVLEGVPEWVGVPHGFDALFVWGLPYWAQLPSGAQWDRADKQIAEIIMTLWANFAKFGNPTEMGVYIKWEKFTADSPGILIVDRAFNMSDRSNMNYGSVQFWNEYYPKVVTFASQCCNATNVAASWHTDIPREATGILLLAHFGIFLATLIART
uniref:Putative fatty acyl-coa hydrolase medium chain-like protein n=1 Tax=Lutzomyia longipalpis TaxID=7200 RepID=A0A1B0EUA7_LUTLO